MRTLRVLLALIICCAAASESPAQQSEYTRAKRLAGCWSVEPGPFSTVGRVGTDAGQTVLPAVIQLDTVPGTSWNGDLIGRRIRSFADGRATRYRNGYYLFAGTDSLRVEWTNGVVGMTLQLQVDNVVMRGRASAWTDYMGNEQATIVLRRVRCPGRRPASE